MTDQRKQCGMAAIEFAFILPVMLLPLALTLFLGRICWHYTVAHKAAHDAGLILANAAKLEIGVSKGDLSDVEVANLAKAVVAEEIAELNPGWGARPRVEVYCDSLACIGGARRGK